MHNHENRMFNQGIWLWGGLRISEKKEITQKYKISVRKENNNNNNKEWILNIEYIHINKIKRLQPIVKIYIFIF